MIKIQELLSYQAPELRHRLAGMGARAETGSDSAVQASPGGGAADGGRTEGRRAGHRSRSKKLKGKVITMQAKVEGRVKWFDPIRGYGFAVRLDGGGDVFLHHRRLINADLDMKKGAVILFSVLDDPKGPVAVDVEIVGSSDKNKKETGSCIL